MADAIAIGHKEFVNAREPVPAAFLAPATGPDAFKRVGIGVQVLSE